MVIFIFLCVWYSWNGTSAAAISNSPADIHKALQPTTCKLWMIACSSGSLAIDSKAWRSPESTTTATTRITKNLASALSNSVKACIENMRLIPDSGFMRLNFGCNKLPENRKPLSAMGATKEITNSRISTGCTAHMAILPEASRKAPMARSSTMMSRVKLKFMRINASNVSAK
ncbi:hypothetical protein D3C76_1268010 [compost metagenome]